MCGSVHENQQETDKNPYMLSIEVSLTGINFLFRFAAEFWPAEDGQVKCGCKQACKETDYVPKMTAYKYINPHLAALLGYTPGQ